MERFAVIYTKINGMISDRTVVDIAGLFTNMASAKDYVTEYLVQNDKGFCQLDERTWTKYCTGDGYEQFHILCMDFSNISKYDNTMSEVLLTLHDNIEKVLQDASGFVGRNFDACVKAYAAVNSHVILNTDNQDEFLLAVKKGLRGSDLAGLPKGYKYAEMSKDGGDYKAFMTEDQVIEMIAAELPKLCDYAVKCPANGYYKPLYEALLK